MVGDCYWEGEEGVGDVEGVFLCLYLCVYGSDYGKALVNHAIILPVELLAKKPILVLGTERKTPNRKLRYSRK